MVLVLFWSFVGDNNVFFLFRAFQVTGMRLSFCCLDDSKCVQPFLLLIAVL